MSFYLAIKEVWRNRGRYLLFSLVIALITTLVLFIAALAGGLANANKQFIEKLDADLLVYQENVDLLASASRLSPAKVREVRRQGEVADAGAIGFSTATIVFGDGRQDVDVSLIGVEAGRPGEPQIYQGAGLLAKRDDEAIIELPLAESQNLQVGDAITVKTVQGTDEEFFELKIVGVTDQRQYFFQPSLIVPLTTWDKIRPQASNERNNGPVIANVLAVKLQDPKQSETAALRLTQAVDGIEVADKPTAIQAIPGYAAQQSTLNTQQAFTLLIGILVVGGFFQIQTLQKVAQIGVLKAIGSPSRSVALTVLLQIVLVTVFGVAIGSAVTLALAMGMPNNVPVLFSGPSVSLAIAALLLIGPLGGLVSVHLALKIDPLTAIGLAS